MKFAIWLLLSLAICTAGFGQQDISEIKGELLKAKSDSQKYIAYQKLYRYYEFSQSDSAIYYLEQGYKEFTASRYQLGLATVLSMMGETYSSRGMLEIGRKKLEEALAIFTTSKDNRGIADANNGIGVIDGRSGHYDSAVRHFLIALRVFEHDSDKKGITRTYIKLGAANEFSGNYDKALEYYKDALNIARNFPVSGNLITLYNNIGVVYCRKEQFKEGEGYFRTALELTADPKFEQLRIQPLNNMGNLFKETGDDVKALDYYNKSLEIADRERLPEDRARALLDIALITLKSNPDKALISMKEALKTAREISQKALESEILDGMIAVYKQKGDYKEAFHLYDQNKRIQDSLTSVDKAREIANLQAQYDLDKSNAEVKELRISEKENAEKKNVIVVIAVSVTICLLVVAFFLWKTHTLNRKLLTREQQLEKANFVKDRLFSIVGHDLRGPVANIPTLLSIVKADDTTDDERTFIFNEMEESVNASLLTLDNLLTWGKAQIKGITLNQRWLTTGDILNHEINLLKIAAENKKLTVLNSVPAETKVYADADHFKIIVRNLLANAIKYSEANSKVEISADEKPAPGFVTFCVRDYGVGMSDVQQKNIFELFNVSTTGTADETGNSIGLLLCKSFVQENGGRIWVESAPGKGSSFYFSLKNSG